MHRLVVPLGMLALLSACALGPDHRPPEAPAPSGWSQWHGGAPSLLGDARRAPPGNVASGDWKAFGDPLLDRLQERALAANHELRAAALRFAQSRAMQRAAASQQLPQLGLHGGVQRQRQSETGAATRMIDALGSSGAQREQLIRSLSQPFDLYQAGFDASWEIDLWGRVRRNVEAAEADSAASAAMLRQVQLAVQAELARRYFELRGTQRELRLAEADLSAAAQSLALVQARASHGQIAQLDALRQHTLVKALRARLPLLLLQEAQAIDQITLLVGEPPGALNAELAAGSASDEVGALPALALGVPGELARRRPDIAAAEARLHAATARIGVAVAELYPRVTLGANLGYESVGHARFGEWGGRQWQIGPSLSLPLFDHGRRRATVTLRELQQQEAAVAFQQTVLQAWHEVDAALSAYAAEQQRQAELQARVRDSRDALGLAEARHARGLTDFGVELDARRELLQAEREAVQSRSQLAVKLVAIYKALAGGMPL